MAAKGEDTDQGSTAWNTYVCKSLSEGCPHPGEIVEPASLAAVLLPPLNYPILDSLKHQVEKGMISQLQLEGVAYACQKHQQVMPNGSRFGFFIGDATGTGKGRQIAGIVLDNICRGRRRHLWCSTSADLIKDAMRDLQDLDANVAVHDGVRMLDRSQKGLGVSKDSQKGVLFTTYASLVASTNSKDRFSQICNWLGDSNDFDGCLIFDECHKAKHFDEKEGKGSKVAKAVVRLQQKFPNARCVYVSATGVSDINNMAYMDRLGLWGKGTAFGTFEDFRNSMGKRNMGALEMLAIELKSTGLHVSRGLSFKDTTFNLVKAGLTPEQLSVYKAATEYWNDLRLALVQAIQLSNSNSKVWGPFWSAHQRFFKQLCIAFKIPDIVKLSRQALAQGHCVVIGLQSTGEASIDFWTTQDSKDRDQVPVCFTSNLLVIQFLQNHFPSTAVSDNPRGGKPNSEENQSRLSALYNKILERAMKLPLPTSAIDDLVYQLGGASAVAEMTGRRSCVVASQPKHGSPQNSLKDVASSCKVIPRLVLAAKAGKVVSAAAAAAATGAELDSINISEKDAFMKGSKLIAIISDAASTGISLHADRRVENQRRRIHITCELAWAADTAVQQLGRSHRSSQVNAPLFKLVTSGIGGENRFVSAVASRLRSLGALTHGDRRASSAGIALDDFVFDSTHGKLAFQEMCNNTLMQNIVPGVSWPKVLERAKPMWRLAGWKEEDEQLTSVAPYVQLSDPHQYWRALHMPQTNVEFLQCVAQSLRLIYEGVAIAAAIPSTAGVQLNMSDTDRKSVKKFLNKMLGLPVHLQALLFEYFSATLDSIVEQSKLDGSYDEGVSDVHANSVSADGPVETLYTDPSTGGDLNLHVLRLDRGISFEKSLDWLQRAIDIAKAKARAKEVNGTAHEDGEEDATMNTETNEDSQTPANDGTSTASQDERAAVSEVLSKPEEKAAPVVELKDCQLTGPVGAMPTCTSATKPHTSVKSTQMEEENDGQSTPDDAAEQEEDESISKKHENASTLVKEARNLSAGGFYVSRKAIGPTHELHYILAVKLDPRSERYTIFRPNTGRANLEKTKRELKRMYSKVKIATAEAKWTELFEQSATGCAHGPECSEGKSCSYGSRISNVGILSGAVVPLWNQLQEVLEDPDLDIPRYDQRLRIVRAQLDTGERLIGIKWHAGGLSALRKMLELKSSQYHPVRMFVPVGAKNFGFAIQNDLGLKATSTRAEAAGIKNGQILTQVGDIRLGPGATREHVFALIKQKFNQHDRSLDIVVRDPDTQDADDKKQGSLKVRFEKPTPIDPACKKALLSKPMTIKGFFSKMSAATSLPAPKRSANVSSVGDDDDTLKTTVLKKKVKASKSADPKRFFFKAVSSKKSNDTSAPKTHEASHSTSLKEESIFQVPATVDLDDDVIELD